VLTGEKEGDGAKTDPVKGKQSQVLGGGRLMSEEGGEVSGHVGARQGAHACKGDGGVCADGFNQ
jgi:hypothetical protein